MTVYYVMLFKSFFNWVLKSLFYYLRLRKFVWISRTYLSLSSVRPLLKRTMVSRNSWKEILPSPSLSTMLNILWTKTSESFMPKALANSFLDKVVRITMITSLVTSSNFLFSPGFRQIELVVICQYKFVSY